MQFVLLDDQGTGKQLVFRRPEQIITARNRADLAKAFADIDAAQASGKWLAGWMAYDLGHRLEPRFDTAEFNASPTPLIQLGVFNEAPDNTPPVDWLYTRDIPPLKFKPSWTEDTYLNRFEHVQAFLKAGDCYQVNLTFPMFTKSDASPTQIYAAFRRRQPGRYGAVTCLGDTDIVSFSPELFFERRGRHMRMRPMKGTRPRKPSQVEDAAVKAEMQTEPKSRAENLMIVDLLRNDLSRLCEPGSVKVPELFTLETYPTLHQMTSQITGQLRDEIKWADIFRGLFPCGSVTGAPKIRAMEIIHDLEDQSRQAYCGTVGYIAPDGDASFSVAIRTVQMKAGQLRYDVGSGVVLDSDGPDEYRECLLKARIFDVSPERPFETFRQFPNGDIPRRDDHVKRLHIASAYSEAAIHDTINTLNDSSPAQDLRIRIEAKIEGLKTTQTNYVSLKLPLKLALSRYPLEPQIQTTSIKTTRRDFYDGERSRLAALRGVDEVIFFNKKSHLCEGSFTSIFIQQEGKLYTPSLSSGLLPGILRDSLLKTGDVIEKTLTLEDLKSADQIFVGNSLRGLMAAEFIDFDEH